VRVITALWLVLASACGASEASLPAAPASRPATAPAIDQPPIVVASSRDKAPSLATRLDAHACTPSDTPVAHYRFALIAAPYEPTQSIASKDLVEKWRGGAIAASDETSAVLSRVLGARTNGTVIAPASREPLASGWAIVPAHELSPAWRVIAVDRVHPLVGESVLAIPLCGNATGNIDRAKLTTLVMSGTTALTGRTAKRVDDTGVRDTVKHIAPFFRSADLVHVSNEVAFVRGCDPKTGQEKEKLKFCSRDRYIELLAALDTDLVELTGSHLTDYGQRAMARTIRMYEKRGWQWFGGGRTQIEASAPRFVEHNGNRLAFVGCNAVNWWVRAISSGIGTANCDWARMKWQIQELRREGYLPIATVQHRELRTHTPAPDLVRDLRGLAEAGAMFVLGSQAHVAHPWDVHHGAYVHYGPGNILFAQYRDGQREATVDKLYVHDGRLLSVEHIYTRTEKGRPRLLSDDERGVFLADLAVAAANVTPPEPWTEPVLPPASRERPDSLVVDGRAQRLRVTQPAQVERGKRYPLILDLDGTQTARDDAFYVTRVGGFVLQQSKVARGKTAGAAKAKDIVRYLRTKYPIDKRAITITADPEHPEKRRRSKRHRSRTGDAK
jgi:hypothetical protein